MTCKNTFTIFCNPEDVKSVVIDRVACFAIERHLGTSILSQARLNIAGDAINDGKLQTAPPFPKFYLVAAPFTSNLNYRLIP